MTQTPEPINPKATLFGENANWVNSLRQQTVRVGSGALTRERVHHDDFGKRVRLTHQFRVGEGGFTQATARASREPVHAIQNEAKSLLTLSKSHEMVSGILDLLPQTSRDEATRKRALNALKTVNEQIGPLNTSNVSYENRRFRDAIRGSVIGPKTKAEEAEELARKAQKTARDLAATASKRPLEPVEEAEFGRARAYLESPRTQKLREIALKYSKLRGIPEFDSRVEQLKEELGIELSELRHQKQAHRRQMLSRRNSGKPATKTQQTRLDSLTRQIEKKKIQVKAAGQKVRQVKGAIELVEGYTITRLKGKRRTPYQVQVKGNWPAAAKKLNAALPLVQRRIDDLRDGIIPRLAKQNESIGRFAHAINTLGRLHGSLLATAATVHDSLSPQDAQVVARHLQEKTLQHFGDYDPRIHQAEMEETAQAHQRVSAAIQALSNNKPREARNHLLTAAQLTQQANERILAHLKT